MSNKLDPQLADLVGQSEAGGDDRTASVDVLVGLDAPLDAATRADLIDRGLRVRSEIGTVLTGSVMLQHVRRVADSPRVVKIEASVPLYRERTPSGE